MGALFKDDVGPFKKSISFVGGEEEGDVLPVESVTGPAGLQEHLFLINCIPFFGNPPPACPMLFSFQKQGFFYRKSHIVI